MRKRSRIVNFFLISILLFSFACKDHISKSKAVVAETIFVNLKNEPLKTSLIFKDPILIRLQPGVSPIGRIDKLKVFDDNIYILSNMKIFKYGSNGSFLNILDKSGRGPGEYVSPFDFLVDEDDNIEVLDFRGKKILKYDKYGGFLDEWKNEMYAFAFIKDKEKYFIFGGNSNKVTDYEDKMVFVFNKWKGHVIEKYIPVDKNMANYLNFVDLRNIQKINNEIFLGFSPYDTIYKYDDGLLSTIFIIDFGNRKIDQQIYSRKFDDILAFNQFLTDKDLCHYIYNFLLSPQLLFFNFFYKNNYWLGVYNRESGLVLNSNVIEDDLFLIGNKYQTQNFFPMEYYDGYYYFLLQPYELVNFIKEKGLDKISKTNINPDTLSKIQIEDNPLIIKFKSNFPE